MVLLHNRLYENRITPPTGGSFELFLTSFHRDSRIHAGAMEDWCCLYSVSRRGGQESLLENRRFLCHLRSFGIWSLKEYFSLWRLITAEHWAATGSLLGPGECPDSHLYILPSYLSHCPTVQGPSMFGSGSFLLLQLACVCALEGVRRKSSSSRVLKTSLGLIAEALKGRELHMLQLWVFFMVFSEKNFCTCVTKACL